MSIFREAAERLDAWVHNTTGLGARGSKGRATGYYSDAEPDPEKLDALFQNDWLSNLIVRAPIDDALAGGFEVEGDDGTLFELWSEVNRTGSHPDGVYQAAAYAGALHGGGVLVGGFRAGSPEQPWVGGDLLWLEPYSRHQITVEATNSDRNSPNYGDPELIKIRSGRRKDLIVHTSRCIWFGGAPAIGTRKEELDDFWHESVLRAPMRSLERYGFSWEAIGHLLQESEISVMKIQGLIKAISAEQGSEFLTRMRLMNSVKGITGMLLLDADKNESLERSSTSWAGIPQVLDSIMLDVAGAAGIPQTRLFQRSPSGMNATGASDIATYNAKLDVQRTNSHGPKLRQLLIWLGESEPVIHWPALEQQSGLEIAQERKVLFEGDAVLQSLGIDGLDIVRARVEDGTLDLDLPEEAYTFTEPDPPQPPPPMLGAVPLPLQAPGADPPADNAEPEA